MKVRCVTTDNGKRNEAFLSEREAMAYAMRQYPDHDWGYNDSDELEDRLTELGEKEQQPQHNRWVTYHIDRT